MKRNANGTKGHTDETKMKRAPGAGTAVGDVLTDSIMTTTVLMLMMVVVLRVVVATAAARAAANRRRFGGGHVDRTASAGWTVANVDLRSGDGQRVALGTRIVQRPPVEHLVHGRGHLALACDAPTRGLRWMCDVGVLVCVPESNVEKEYR